MKATVEDLHTVHYLERGDEEIELHIWFTLLPEEPADKYGPAPHPGCHAEIEVTRIARKFEDANYEDFEPTDEEHDEIEESCWDSLDNGFDGPEYETD